MARFIVSKPTEELEDSVRQLEERVKRVRERERGLDDWRKMVLSDFASSVEDVAEDHDLHGGRDEKHGALGQLRSPSPGSLRPRGTPVSGTTWSLPMGLEGSPIGMWCSADPIRV